MLAAAPAAALSSSAAAAAEAVPARPLKRRRRIALPPPLPEGGDDEDVMEREVQTVNMLAQAHLDRLRDRIRHTIRNMPLEVKTDMIWRFSFDGVALPGNVKPNKCWWFKKGRGDSRAIYQSDPINGPPRGIRRTCYALFTDASLRTFLQIDWQNVTAQSVLQIFARCNQQSVLVATGLEEVLAECTSRPRAPLQFGSPLTLHIWDFINLAQQYAKSVMDPLRSWELTYPNNFGGQAFLPPWRIPNECIVPLTEHEAQRLLRRPSLGHILRVVHNLRLSGQWEEVERMAEPSGEVVEQNPEEEGAEEEEEKKQPMTPRDNFRDDRSYFSNVTPNASYMSTD